MSVAYILSMGSEAFSMSIVATLGAGLVYLAKAFPAE